MSARGRCPWSFIAIRAPRARARGLPKTLDLADEATRRRFATGGDLQVRKAEAGFAVVLSRAEKKVAFVDLQPIFRMIDMRGARAERG